ncbi:nitrite reductase large subunit NirB [Catenulispora pinisilvae]|uniref:nitrite reductase large subunit NirB n=1 Tax=Catenulispora pinisilvae TaxID=2705253 RepID=UPI0018917E5B|nr:nitrite reductase large subunit NirB [Catenulispora pinisilvae]
MSPSQRTVLVVGHGMVGHRFVSSLLEHGHPAPDVTVFGAEDRPAYDRVRLSSWFEDRDPASLRLEPYSDGGVEVLSGVAVAGVDREARTVTTADGDVRGYDTLVLATGSRPFVPPVENHQAPGCFVYRTLDDVEAIAAYAAEPDRTPTPTRARTTGVVVGGGLLGLEAAKALTSLGLKTTVVEFAPRLMPLQVDDGGAAALQARIAELGVTLHTGTRLDKVVVGEDGAATAVQAVRGDDVLAIEADLVVFAAGVRPEDSLARAAGLDVGERGGIVVDSLCRTEDRHIYAIGECALAADGRVYGLVAPGYQMAEAAAAHIAKEAEDRAFTGADTSTKLKLLGVEVASFGDAFGVGDGATSATYSDSRRRVYRKLTIAPDGRLLGGILVGDAEDYGTLRALVGEQPPAAPEALLLPAGTAGAVSIGPCGLPDSAVLCSCHNVTKGAICTAIHDLAGQGDGQDDGEVTPKQIGGCTKAGTGCGSCVTSIKALIKAEGGGGSSGLCEHFSQTRSELYTIVRRDHITGYAELLAKHGTAAKGVTDGCDVCKPAVGSILASLGGLLAEGEAKPHVLDGGQAALQDTNDHVLANLQRNGSYSVVPRIPGGEITPDKLIVIGEVARDFGLYTKITGGQRIDMFGARMADLPKIWQRLVDAGFESGHAYGKALRTVKSCVGSTWCRYGVQDSVKMAIDLELRYRGLRAPHKIKMAVSGCARECAEAQSKDVGVIATERGWNLYVGGNGGARPRHADLLATDLDEAALIRTIDRFLALYIAQADRLERTATWVERYEGGLDRLRSVLIDDVEDRGAELEGLITAHVEAYTDEWRAVLEDPVKLARFATFVNAPQAPDPTVAFVPERGQIKPLLTLGRR